MLLQWRCRFVRFTDEYGLKKAVNWFDGKTLHGRKIKVEETYQTKQQKSPREGLHAVSLIV